MAAGTVGRRPTVLALTGGIGAGKSAALEAFAGLGVPVLSADAVVHGLYGEREVVEAIRARFGSAVLDAHGAVDRTALGARVFADRDAKAFVEGLLFPRIRAACDRWVAAQRSGDPPPALVVCEVPLLYEARLEGQFDAVAVITAGEDVRRARVTARGQDFGARAQHQIPEAVKVARADHVFVNDGSLAALEAWVTALYDRYRDEPAGAPS